MNEGGRRKCIVVGGGLAGLVAANRCAELGHDLVLVERGTGERYPANSRYAAGFINCAFRDIGEGVPVLRAAIDALTAGAADPELADVFAANAAPALDWLAAQGAQLIRGGWEPGHRHLLAPPPVHRPGLNWEGRGPDVTLRRLTQALARRGGAVMLGCRARELVLRDGICTGVVVEQGGVDVRLEAQAVLLADGGFQANAELMRRYVSPRPDRLVQRNAQTGTGDGLRMAVEAGARLVGMEAFYGHLLSRDALTNSDLWPWPTIDLLAAAGLVVDVSGRRFADEGLGGIFLANVIAHRDDPLDAFAIFDHATWEKEGRSTNRPVNPAVPQCGGTVHSAQTWEALASSAGIDAAGLARTVRDFNRAVREGGGLPVPRSGLETRVPSLGVPPYYAIPLAAGITYTMGGIAIDAQCRVLGEKGPIPGLYAAGSTTGGHEGGPVAGYTGGLGKAMTFGWHAGNSIAAALSPAPR